MKNQELELRYFVSVIARQFRVISTTFVAVFGTALIFLYVADPKFTATGLILVDPGQKSILNPDPTTNNSSGTNNSIVDSEVEILRADAVLLGVIDRLNLLVDREFKPKLPMLERLMGLAGMAQASPTVPNQPLSQTLSTVKDSVSVRRKGLTFLISISASSQSPLKAAELANSVAEIYVEQQVGSKVARASAARDILANQIASARARLSAVEAEFDTRVSAHRARLQDLPGGEVLGALNIEIEKTDQVLASRSQRLTMANRQFNEQAWGALAKTLNDKALQSLEMERRRVSSTISEGTNLIEVSPDLQRQLELLELELTTNSQALLSRSVVAVGELETQASAQKAQLRQAMFQVDLPADIVTEIFAIQQESNVARAQYQNLLARSVELETQTHIQMSNSRIVSPALPPAFASFPNKNLVLLAAFAATAGLGISLAFLNEYYIGGVVSEEQLADLTQYATATTIPRVLVNGEQPERIAELIVAAPLSPYSESVRRLRAGIDQRFRANVGVNGLKSGRTILVTSPNIGEGKTTTALALARTYALAGMKTLLIDSDLRHPSVHKELGVGPHPGFLDFLRNSEDTQITSEFYAKDSQTPLAMILGAERSDIPTDQLLNSNIFSALLEQAREVYDVIIIDSPPLLPIVDALYIAHHADAVVLTVKWAGTSQNDLRATMRNLETAIRKDAQIIPVLTQQGKGSKQLKRTEAYSDYSAAI